MSPRAVPSVIIEELECNEENEITQLKPGEYPIVVAKPRSKLPVVDLSHLTQNQDEGLGLELSLVTYMTPEYRRDKRLKASEGSYSCSKKLSFNLGEEDTTAPVPNTAVADKDITTLGANKTVDAPDCQSYDFEDFDPFFGFSDEDARGATYEAARTEGEGEQHEAARTEGEGEQHEAARTEGEGEQHEVARDEGESEQQEGEGEPNVSDGENTEDDNDYLEDEENYVSDVEVDMTDFYLNVDVDVEAVDGVDGGKNDGVDVEDLEDVEVIDNDEWDSAGENSDDERRKAVLKQLSNEKRCSHGQVHPVYLHVGQKFKSKKEIKARVDKLAIATRRNLSFKKNDLIRLRAMCKGKLPDGVGGPIIGGKPTCTWSMQASRSKENGYWFVKTLNDKHICFQTRKIRACTAKFIAMEIVDQVELNPTVPLRSLQDQLQNKYDLGVSIHKVQRAKAAALNHVIGDYTKQYEVLRDYLMELQATNDGTTVKLEVVSEANLSLQTRQFKRVYVCFGALKKGFKAGLRDLIGLDGAFMKGPFPGQVLTAVGVDSNNGIYPVAYAIVEAETASSWKWFLQCLGDDLGLYANSNFTFISDRQKGIIPALAQLYPCAEHRFCLRHIYDNMKKTWKTREYKDFLWKCATATTVPEFDTCMTEFSQFDRQAFEWLKKIPAQHWARSHFSGRAVSDMLLNNLCEVFNSKLIHGRDKPIISCLEFIRQYLMKRICNVLKVMAKSPGPLTPTASKLLEINRSNAVQYRARWNGTSKYEVYGPWHDQHVVNMKEMTCTCRRWDLNGIPCKHAIATINEMGDSGEKVGELYTYVNKVYWMDTWKNAYSYKIDPIKGRSMWPKSPCPFKLTPPPHHTQPGRPKTKRKRSADERNSSQSKKINETQTQGGSQTQRLTKKFVSVTCGKCHNRGHNSRTCKGQQWNEGGTQ
ncbi:hypothetical protein L1887_36704 [Cichorium endivia]|nr:hypothetical protein L1887_36704 [Cichorium endivia]